MLPRSTLHAFDEAAELSTQANLNSGATWTNQTGNFNSAAGASANLNTQITGVTPDPFNASTAYVTLSGFTASTGVNHIFKTTNFGSSWSNVTGDLTDVPVLRLLVDNQDSTGNTLLAATDIGVFRSINGGANWVLFNQGVIPSLPIFDIEESPNGVIYAGSHGRGAYKLVAGSTSPTPTPSSTPTSGITPTPTPTLTPTPSPTLTSTPSPAPTNVPASIKAAPRIINFGKVAVGAVSKPHKLALRNASKPKLAIPITLESANIDNNRFGFFQAGTSCFTDLVSLRPKQKCVLSLGFQPSTTGPVSATLTIHDNADNQLQQILLKGVGK